MISSSAARLAPTSGARWVGVVAYSTRVGLDPGRALAIGDDHRLQTLAAAAIAVAPRDACREALDIADRDHVVGSPRDGGWAEVLNLV